MFELGNNLRDARERRRIDLVAAEQDTKIRSKYLSALENENFEVLPGPVFIRGFIRTYARYLDLDPQLFIDEYNARFGRFEESDDDPNPVFGRPSLAHAQEVKGRRLMRTVFLLTTIVIALLAWLGLRGVGGDDVQKIPTHTAHPVPVEITPERSDYALQEAANAAKETPVDTPKKRGTTRRAKHK